ncbi:MAG TPA: fibronectin type III domain-containing protein [Candidatus Paceibacterota bacterium]
MKKYISYALTVSCLGLTALPLMASASLLKLGDEEKAELKSAINSTVSGGVGVSGNADVNANNNGFINSGNANVNSRTNFGAEVRAEARLKAKSDDRGNASSTSDKNELKSKEKGEVKAGKNGMNSFVQWLKQFRTKAVAQVDAIAPKILFESSFRINSTSSHVVWVTNENSDSKVWLSTSAGVSTSTTPRAVSSSMSLFHNLTVSGLATSTTYFYVVGSTDASGNTIYSAENSFKTTLQ